MNIVEIIRREISRALSSARLPFRGRLAQFKNRTSGAMLAQGEGLAGEALQDAEMFQQAGFVSGPPAGTQVIVLPLGGKTVHSVIIATEFGQYRVAVAPGEVALYHLTEPDCWVHLKNGRIIGARCARLEIQADEEIAMTAPQFVVNAAAQATFTTPLLRTSDALHVGADATIRASQPNPYTLDSFVQKYNTHTHAENDAGGPTDATDAGHQVL